MITGNMALGDRSPDEARLDQSHTHSNPTNLLLFRHKITLYRFNQGRLIILQAGGSNGSRRLSQHTFVVWRTAPLHLDDYLRLICFLKTSVYSALGVSAIMRCIN